MDSSETRKPAESDADFYARRAQQELDLAAGSDDPAVKAVHLNMASKYATLREHAIAPRAKLTPRFEKPAEES